MALIFLMTEDADSPLFDFLLANKADFEEMFGPGVVGQKMQELVLQKAFSEDNDEQTAPIQLSAAPTTLDVAARRKALLTGCRSASLPSAAKLSSPLEDKNCPASCAEGSKSEAHMADNNPQNKSVQWAKETDPFTLQNKDLKTAIKLLQGRVQQLVIGLTSVC